MGGYLVSALFFALVDGLIGAGPIAASHDSDVLWENWKNRFKEYFQVGRYFQYNTTGRAEWRRLFRVRMKVMAQRWSGVP